MIAASLHWKRSSATTSLELARRVCRFPWWACSSRRNGRGREAGYPALPAQIDEIAENHEAYTGEGKIPASPAIRALLR